MSVVFVHPDQDKNGNSRENIYLALQDGQYLGHAYAWPFENHHVAYERPWNVYFEVNPEPQLDAQLLAQVRDGLYDHILSRAMELRALQPQMAARVYSSAQYEEQLAYLVARGLRDDDAMITMAAPLTDPQPLPLPEDCTLEACDAGDPEVLQAYRQAHNTVFVSPLDDEEFAQHRQMPHFTLYRLRKGTDTTLAWAQVFQKEGSGQVETILVTDGSRSRGLGKAMLSQMLAIFARWGCERTTLEVWQRNRRAVALYESFGYHKVRTVFWFPGIDLSPPMLYNEAEARTTGYRQALS